MTANYNLIYSKTPWQFFLLGDWFFKLVNKLTVSLLTIMLALELVWKLTLKNTFLFLRFIWKTISEICKICSAKLATDPSSLHHLPIHLPPKVFDTSRWLVSPLANLRVSQEANTSQANTLTQ